MERADEAKRLELANWLFAALRRALRRLPRDDRRLLELIQDGVPLVDIAQALGQDQQALCRRKRAILERLRADLGAESIDRPDGHELLSILDWNAIVTSGG